MRKMRKRRRRRKRLKKKILWSNNKSALHKISSFRDSRTFSNNKRCKKSCKSRLFSKPPLKRRKKKKKTKKRKKNWKKNPIQPTNTSISSVPKQPLSPNSKNHSHNSSSKSKDLNRVSLQIQQLLQKEYNNSNSYRLRKEHHKSKI